MKLSDEKLMKLLKPLIAKEVQEYGLEKITIEGKLDQGGDDAIYIDVWLNKNNFEYIDLSKRLNDIVSDNLLENDDRIFYYLYLHNPPRKDKIYNFDSIIDTYELRSFAS